MFIHSVPIPKLYKAAAKQLREVKETGTSLKQVVYSRSRRPQDIKRTFVLVLKALEQFSEIDTIIEKSELLVKESRFDPWLARILVTELLWSDKELRGESKPVQTILSYRAILEELKATLESKTPKKTIKKVKKPRYVRVNTLSITVEEAVNAFRDEGWKLVRSNSLDYEEFLSKIVNLEEDEFMIDIHIKELLLFPFNTEFYQHNAYKRGLIILQDKASCLPVHLLNPTPGSTALDMCAAPGMKTSHLAAALNGQGTVYAVERCERRFKTLNEMVERLDTSCIKTINKDVLKVSEADCPNVEYILVDPSCSGSGMTDRVTVGGQSEAPSSDRLQKLANLQIIILKHALTHFPQAKRVVYSTCSVYWEENEYVVTEVLKNSNIDFKLVSAKALLNDVWKNNDDAVSNDCISTKPEKDLTNGFFIAVFERSESHQQGVKTSELKEENIEIEKNINTSANVDEGQQAVSEFDETFTMEVKMEDEYELYKKQDESPVMSNKKSRKEKHKSKSSSDIVKNDQQEVIAIDATISKKSHKQKKKQRDCERSNEENEQDTKQGVSDQEHQYANIEGDENNAVIKKKNKKRKQKENLSDDTNHFEEAGNAFRNQEEEIAIPKKKKTKKKRKDEIEHEENTVNIGDVDNSNTSFLCDEENVSNKKKPKKEKHRLQVTFEKEELVGVAFNNSESNVENISLDHKDENSSSKKKNKKNKRKAETELDEEQVNDTGNFEADIQTERKKRKKDKISKKIY